jgi:methanogenic corrinoid protein MtbC1
MLAAVGGELHVVALRMIANLLHDVGYGVVMLGPDVPASALASAAVRHEPDVVCLTATMPGGAEQVLISIHEIMRDRPQAGFVVGGRGISQRIRPRPGIEVCARVSEVVEAVDAVVKHAGMN